MHPEVPSNAIKHVDANIFQERLETFFSEKRQTEPPSGQHISISRENSEAAGSPSTAVTPDSLLRLQNQNSKITPRRECLGTHMNQTVLDYPSSPRSPNGQTNGGTYSESSPSAPPESAPSPAVTKDLDYRVRGIRLEYTGNDVLSYLSRKLDIEPNVVGRIKALATSPTGDKIAVVAWRPQPACLSTPGKDEWDFGPTDNDDDIHITVDTHFRGVTVLYTPPPNLPHTME
ncbi:uncharacterized protein N7482_001315 [Penicillium canariense]|uniref:Uncharacterized protein n=1 Tax=Penicillium canariense TaxID=189055 RepID=A0A9W9IEW1_9EURO|nr:uncharacterized protein N7482_001315 [Penicillium canariense]KAJ5175438.1 hypothetical protein N7482_001315 [Penicillium canariense]